MGPTGGDVDLFDSRGTVRSWINRGLLHGATCLLAIGFAARSLFRRGRATHTVGVGAGGHLRVVDNVGLPENDFFRPGRTFRVLARHATALRTDEVERDFRSLALKFFDGERADALDLVMNTGQVQGFWHAANFLRGAIGGALGEFGRRWYIRNNPPAFDNVLAGIRRAPASYTQLSYYAAISFNFEARDGSRHLVRFRVIPHDRGPESGMSTGDDLDRPWFERRRPDEDRGAGWLRAEYAARLRSGSAARYVLQAQLRPHTFDQRAYDIGQVWEEQAFPWADLGHLILDRLLDPDVAEGLRFRIDNQPPCLSIPTARSPGDYRSIGWMRPRIYRWLQAWRRVVPDGWDQTRAHERHAWRRPNGFTVLLDIRDDPDGLTAELVRVGDAIGRVPEAPFERVTSLHFFRMQVIRTPQPRLLLDWVHDGPIEDHLDEFLLAVGAWLEPLLRKHAGLTGSVRAALRAGSIQARTLHSGDASATAADVAREERLREVVGAFVDERMANGGWPEEARPEEIRRAIRAHVLAAADPTLPKGLRPGTSKRGTLRRMASAACSLASPWSGLLRSELRAWLQGPGGWRGPLRGAAARLLLFAHGLWTGPPTAWVLGRVEKLEQLEAFAPDAPTPEDIEDLIRREDHLAQNPLSMVCDVRDHPHRRWLLALVLRGAENASRHLWNRGELAGINTIHCARFFQIDDGRCMLFLSDYDGSWERYLNDFLTVGRVAVVPIFANVSGCPPTRRLFGTTPGFAQRFLSFTRQKQSPVHLWYSAWPSLSLRNRIANARLRAGLFAERMSDAEALTWLQEVL